ncbi:MAG: O-antigen ligase family protein [Candidatus Sumerlaeia bacterium]|nr:O-antigen ligase family protein [Candidatus Sumerlaeia bacterium]
MTTASLLGIMTFLAGVPAVVVALFAFPQHRRLMLAVMVFATCYVKKPFYQEVFFVNYRGVDRGFAVTIPDLFFFGFYVHALLGGAGRFLWLPFNSLPWFAVVAVSALSLPGSLDPMLGAFTLHKFIRCFVLYTVVVNHVRDRTDVELVLAALAAAVLFEAFLVLWAKYVTQSVVARSVGSFRHPNTLAMYIDLILPCLLGALLTGLVKARNRLLFGTAIVVGFIAVLFTKSRAAMLLLPASLGAVVVASILARPTARKFRVLALGLLVFAVVASLAAPRLIRRFQNAPKESAETREYFNEAARAMAGEHLFGVGLNQYSNALAKTDFYWHVYPDKVDVDDPEEFRESVQGQSRLGTAHHIYWLSAAETGYAGLAVFLLHIGMFWGKGALLFFRESDHLFKSIYLGLSVSTAVQHVHGLLEWIFRQTEVLYLYFILMGMMVAMESIRRRERAEARLAASPGGSGAYA